MPFSGVCCLAISRAVCPYPGWRCQEFLYVSFRRQKGLEEAGTDKQAGERGAVVFEGWNGWVFPSTVFFRNNRQELFLSLGQECHNVAQILNGLYLVISVDDLSLGINNESPPGSGCCSTEFNFSTVNGCYVPKYWV